MGQKDGEEPKPEGSGLNGSQVLILVTDPEFGCLQVPYIQPCWRVYPSRENIVYAHLFCIWSHPLWTKTSIVDSTLGDFHQNKLHEKSGDTAGYPGKAGWREEVLQPVLSHGQCDTGAHGDVVITDVLSPVLRLFFKFPQEQGTGQPFYSAQTAADYKGSDREAKKSTFSLANKRANKRTTKKARKSQHAYCHVMSCLQVY